MPKTRPAESRDRKMSEILAAAERRLRSGGYEALSVAALARELGLAQNAIYWYFPSKDELFVATLNRMLEKIAARKPAKQVGELERILWFTDQFQVVSSMRGAINDRARGSAAVAEFAERLDALLSRMLANVLRDYVPADELPVAVEAFRATVDGAFVKGLDKRDRRKLLAFTLKRLTAGGLE
ncbi:MAG: TetR/AcrR family transcriptional regulator, multidrug resistance operon repressor [Solirubrobacterales bacterium]|jgi:AcrR family transcriptional regulator|nr:TetR/AcrR family transcriptional regulator, multidrug resistance operon repressor [Solirubrobacterales bacterium]